MNVCFSEPHSVAIDVFPSGAGDQGVGIIDRRVSDWAGNRGQGQGQKNGGLEGGKHIDRVNVFSWGVA